ncbi:GNAT family N-acetyltransferase [Nitrospirillum amazonense]|uniref:GNAT family N-acetyltransferase n=1 Tax=Nitrospirillum amazonense TaxID=28077 RepID=UPI0024122E99|nr:N-acetyltransferase [Nitrospirillum amazonense]MDG3441746.1 N-acetyltransferase [Nitrospirillum amazonense]
MALTVRQEGPDDAAAIAAAVRRAYADVPYSDHREHLMIARLRGSAAWIPALSLLAEEDGRVVGHILLTRAAIRGARGSTPTLALAPLSVVPEWRGRGVGGRLVRAAHQRARDLGYGSVVLVGIPDYYPRFGYRPMADHAIAVPFTVPARNCMVLALTPDGLSGVEGMVQYAPEWMDG